MFKIIKDSNLSEGKIQDMFELDSLKIKTFLSREQITTILDLYAYKPSTKEIIIHQYVTNCLFTNMGGNKDTPLDEIAAFFYVLYQTKNFKFKEWCTLIYRAINADNIFYYLEDTGLSAPASYMDMVAAELGDPITMEILMRRHTFTVTPDKSAKATVLFIEELGTKVQEYIANTERMKKGLNDLGIF